MAPGSPASPRTPAGKGPRHPSPHPEPPADLPRRVLPLHASAGPWVRLHACGRSARFFGRTGLHRFDSPAGEFGVLYAAEDDAGAFVEVFGDPLDVRLLSRADLRHFCLAEVAATRRLSLVDLTGGGLSRLGADGRLAAGDDYGISQRWARALWAHPAAPDGLRYPARHDPSKTSVALFERAEPVVRVRRLRRLLDDEGRLGRILDRYGFALVD